MKGLFSAVGRAARRLPFNVSPLWRLPVLKKIALLKVMPPSSSSCIQWLIIMGPQRPDPLVSLGTTLKSSRAPCGGQLRPSLELHHSPTSPSAHPCVFPFSQVLISRALPLSQVWYQGISLVRILYANLCFRVCFLGNLTSNKDKVIYCTSQLVSGRGDIWT